MAIANFTGQHVYQLDAGMPELGIRYRVVLERNEIRLDDDRSAERMSEEIVEMPGLAAAAFDAHALARLHERAIALLIGFAEQPADRDVQRPGQCAQGND